MTIEQPAMLEREFYRSARHSGVDDFTIAEFLLQPGDAQDALLATLFGSAENPQNTEIAGELAR